jgi:hypothetical protein
VCVCTSFSMRMAFMMSEPAPSFFSGSADMLYDYGDILDW